MNTLLRAGLLAVGLAALGCGDSDDGVAPVGDPWHAGKVLASLPEPNARGLLDRRGLIHAHSVYSHDACDGEPRDEVTGAINQPCLADFRAGLCTTQHDFVMLTDHRDSFAKTEFPDVLLYDPAAGDALVERDGAPKASFLACPDGNPALVLAGMEGATMPVGLERHPAPTVAEREALYGSTDPADLETLRSAGALTLVAHTEDWTVDQLATLPLHGFEMYNLHANMIIGAGGLIGIVTKLSTPELLPHSDLVLLPVVSEDKRYVETWGSVLARGVKRVTTMGSDCHQNTIQEKLPDGERGDSYRRMMLWFSNHLLLQPEPDGTWDDRQLKAALEQGRLYGAFEVLGYPQGFDFTAESNGAIAEMGDEVPVGARLVIVPPKLRDRDPRAEAPEITVRLLRALDGGWELVDESTKRLEYTTTSPGAYRAEVRMRPRHLLAELGSYTDLAEQSFVWIYANPIYVK